jgi:RNA polymerase sigma factor (sigma-70 family)
MSRADVQTDSQTTQFDRLIEGLETRMIRAIARIVDDSNDAEDVLQNALTTIWRNLPRMQRHPNPTAVVLKVCIDAAYDVLRTRERAKRLVVPLPVEEVPDSSASPSDRLAEMESRRRLLAAVVELPHNQSLAIHMRYVEELSYTEIAAALGCAESTTRKHVARGLSRLRQLVLT